MNHEEFILYSQLVKNANPELSLKMAALNGVITPEEYEMIKEANKLKAGLQAVGGLVSRGARGVATGARSVGTGIGNVVNKVRPIPKSMSPAQYQQVLNVERSAATPSIPGQRGLDFRNARAGKPVVPPQPKVKPMDPMAGYTQSRGVAAPAPAPAPAPAAPAPAPAPAVAAAPAPTATGAGAASGGRRVVRETRLSRSRSMPPPAPQTAAPATTATPAPAAAAPAAAPPDAPFLTDEELRALLDRVNAESRALSLMPTTAARAIPSGYVGNLTPAQLRAPAAVAAPAPRIGAGIAPPAAPAATAAGRAQAEAFARLNARAQSAAAAPTVAAPAPAAAAPAATAAGRAQAEAFARLNSRAQAALVDAEQKSLGLVMQPSAPAAPAPAAAAAAPAPAAAATSATGAVAEAPTQAATRTLPRTNAKVNTGSRYRKVAPKRVTVEERATTRLGRAWNELTGNRAGNVTRARITGGRGAAKGGTPAKGGAAAEGGTAAEGAVQNAEGGFLDSATDLIKENPLLSVGGGLGAGYLIGNSGGQYKGANWMGNLGTTLYKEYPGIEKLHYYAGRTAKEGPTAANVAGLGLSGLKTVGTTGMMARTILRKGDIPIEITERFREEEGQKTAGMFMAPSKLNNSSARALIDDLENRETHGNKGYMSPTALLQQMKIASAPVKPGKTNRKPSRAFMPARTPDHLPRSSSDKLAAAAYGNTVQTALIGAAIGAAGMGVNLVFNKPGATLPPLNPNSEHGVIEDYKDYHKHFATQTNRLLHAHPKSAIAAGAVAGAMSMAESANLMRALQDLKTKMGK